MGKKELIPRPQSTFVKVKCPKCGNEQFVFDRAAVPVKCNVCEEALAIPRGGKAKLTGEVAQVLG